MAPRKPSRPKKKSTFIGRFKNDPQIALQNEAKKAGVPKPATKAIVGLTAIGLLSGGILRNKIKRLPFGDWLDIPMSWGASLRRMVKK